jgi:hypothetical protein
VVAAVVIVPKTMKGIEQGQAIFAKVSLEVLPRQE